MTEFLSVALGIGLAAACGFRVFVPLLFVSIAAKAGKLTLVSSFQWMGTDAAMIAFSVATAIEIAAYYIPWLDNLLDTIATPAAVVAGAIISASVFTGMDPFLRWTLAVIAGGGEFGRCLRLWQACLERLRTVPGARRLQDRCKGRNRH